MGDTDFQLDSETEADIVERLRSEGCVFAEEETRLLAGEARSLKEIRGWVELRASGMPLEYVLGFTRFCGLRIELEKGVFIPRPRTEFLVWQAKACIRPDHNTVLDLCCGSGAVGAAIADCAENISLHAVDIDPIAVRCASRNLSKIGGRVCQGDLYKALPVSLKGQVNIIVANAPYVPTESIQLLPREARLYEPERALDGGADGLDLHRRIAEKAADWLVSGGHLLMEASEAQGAKTLDIFVEAGLRAKVVRDENLDATVVIGIKPSYK